ncbi:MAG: polyribonucleotide nucleotidyltransferase, partial [Ignavibacteriae bacterium]|nr:polyribonucleotide nucleotidyltransferase [Ignavibacteriota bacterium]
MVVRKEVEIGGKVLSLETGKLAKQADGSVMVRYGDTMVLATVVASKEAKETQDFFPLQVEYREKISSVGKIPGGFFKREGKPSEKEVLSARLIDRPIRPMFPEAFRCETQVIVNVFSSDQEHDADVLGAVAASSALMISDIPFDGPIAEVRVGRVEGQFVINPTYNQLQTSDMDVTVAGTKTSIVMVEGSSKEISEQEMLDALKFSHEFIKILCEVQMELRNECGKPKREIESKQPNEAWTSLVSKVARQKIAHACRQPFAKEERSKALEQIKDETFEALKTQIPTANLPLDETEKAHLQLSVEEFIQTKSGLLKEILHLIEYEEMRKMILEEGRRLDGRGVADIRPITCEIGLLPRTHGSALFTRGETQSLTTATLGTKLDEQILE